MTAPKTETIFEFHKSAGELVQISLTEYRGKKYVDVRIFFDSGQAESAAWKPGKKGICVTIHLLGDLREEIEKAMEAAGLGDDDTE